MKKDRPLQEVIPVGETVFFFAFTKNKEKENPQTHYVCQGQVIDSPSPTTRAPHKVRIDKVGLSRLHGSKGSIEDASSLFGKIIHLPTGSLHRELHNWTAPQEWWTNANW